MKRIIAVLLCGTFFMPVVAMAQYGDTGDSTVVTVISSLLGLYILYLIIAGASRSGKRQKELIRQSNYLKAIAQKLEVSPDVIADIEAIYKKD